MKIKYPNLFFKEQEVDTSIYIPDYEAQDIIDTITAYFNGEIMNLDNLISIISIGRFSSQIVDDAMEIIKIQNDCEVNKVLIKKTHNINENYDSYDSVKITIEFHKISEDKNYVLWFLLDYGNGHYYVSRSEDTRKTCKL